MNTLILILVISVVIFFSLNYLIYRSNKKKYLKAGKKWDGIVKELSRRK